MSDSWNSYIPKSIASSFKNLLNFHQSSGHFAAIWDIEIKKTLFVLQVDYWVFGKTDNKAKKYNKMLQVKWKDNTGPGGHFENKQIDNFGSTFREGGNPWDRFLMVKISSLGK